MVSVVTAEKLNRKSTALEKDERQDSSSSARYENEIIDSLKSNTGRYEFI